MACFKPIEAWRSRFQNSSGKCGITFRRDESNGQRVNLPCGQCIGCRLDRSKQWAVRIVHEASLHDSNSFITLTYNDENLPADGGLRKKHFQDFIKRLRKKLHPKKIRYYMCGEYGDNFGRPHYHAIIFGYGFPDKKLWQTRRENKFYRSELLENLWPYGYSDISNVTFKSAAYVARYVMKKQTGEKAKEHYMKPDKQTGELKSIQPEYNSMSLKPGIAYDWFKQFSGDVYPSDEIVINGKKLKTPRYYDKLLEKTDLSTFEDIKAKREKTAKKHWKNQTPERLSVREKCAQAQTSSLKRELT